jgi:protein TonB
MVESMKEFSLGTVISITVHLCAILLLMVPSLPVQNRPLKVLVVDFSLTENHFKKVSSTNGRGKMIEKRQQVLEDEKVLKGMVETDRPVRENPETITAKKQIIPPAVPTVMTASDTPSKMAIPPALEIPGEKSIGTLSSPKGESAFVGVAATYAGYSGSAGTLPARGGSTSGAADRGQEGRKDKESLEAESEDYNYIRNAVMKNINYPDRARRLGLEGKVLLSFIVLENGTMSEIKVINSSCSRVLDESAKEAVARTRVSKKMTCRVAVRLPITYKLHRAKDGQT